MIIESTEDQLATSREMTMAYKRLSEELERRLRAADEQNWKLRQLLFQQQHPELFERLRANPLLSQMITI